MSVDNSLGLLKPAIFTALGSGRPGALRESSGSSLHRFLSLLRTVYVIVRQIVSQYQL
jgi:hypothetical protein